MCRFKSGIILKNKVVLAPEGNESHSNLLESLNIEDTYTNASKMFVRAELIPEDGNVAVDVSRWDFRVDQDITPDWFSEDTGRYEKEFRDAVEVYMKDRFVIIAGMAWNVIKKDGNLTYYLMYGNLEQLSFGETNNYAESNIRETLNESVLADELKKEFGDKLVPITTNLLSLDGLDDYGTVEGDILAIPTLDLYRECRKNISLQGSSWWLSTPDSTPSGSGSGVVQYVDSDGYVNCRWCVNGGGVRPFFILKS